MRGVGLGGLVLLAGCDGVFNLRAVPDAAPGVDAPRVCERGTPFPTGAPVPIDGQYSVEAARFTDDRSLAYLSLCPAAGNPSCDLYLSQYSQMTGEFTQHSKLSGVSAPTFYDSYPTVTLDGTYLVFDSNRSGTFKLWLAEKVNGSFDQPLLTELAITGETQANEPYVLPGGTLYFAASIASGGAYDIYRANSPLPVLNGATVVGGLATPGGDQAPVVSADELEIIFASNRESPTEPGKLDIYAATRDDPSQPFSMPVPLPAVSQPAGNDWPVWLSPDGCDLYYISKVSGVSTLYVAQR
jgi:Tol biopolymer transport system component